MNQGAKAFAAASTVALLSGMCAGAAHAQTTPTPAAAASEVSEVIVTAQRRSERLNEVPIAISVRSGDQLERAGVTNLRDLTAVTPGVVVSGTGANTQPAIRGIHSEQIDPGNDPNVALYLDGVYQSNPLVNNFDLPDVDHVEVLKGPQGTLFGRNATGGAIRITTRRPSFTPTAIFDASYGKLNEYSAKAFASGPLSGESLAASLSGYFTKRDGYSHDVITGRRIGDLENKGARVKLLAKPTSDLSITLAAGYVDRYDESAVDYEPINGNVAGRVFPGAVTPTRPRTAAINIGRTPAVHSKSFSTSANIDWETEVGSFTATSGFNRSNNFYDTDSDFVQLDLLSFPIWTKQRDVSQEVVFSSRKFGMVQLTAGGYYFHGDGRYDPLEVLGSFQVPTLYGFMQQKTDAYAAFSEVALNPVEPLNIIVGARYSEEKRHATGTYFLSPVRPQTLPELGRDKFKSFTPRAVVRYTLPSDDNVYASYSRGFKSGGFNISGLATKAFRPEKVDAFEIGLKTSPRRRVSANVSAFYYKYKNQQVQSNVNGFNITSNAASSNIKGVDAEVLLKPYAGLTLTLSAAYLDAKFDKYRDAVANLPATVSLLGLPCTLCGNQTVTGLDLSGGREPMSPKLTLGAQASYRTTLDAGDVDLSLSAYHSSRYYYDVNARVAQGAYTTVSGRVGFTPEGTHVTVYAYGRNLTNERYLNTTFINNLGDGGTYSPPRTFGVGARYEF